MGAHRNIEFWGSRIIQSLLEEAFLIATESIDMTITIHHNYFKKLAVLSKRSTIKNTHTYLWRGFIMKASGLVRFGPVHSMRGLCLSM